jgi:hypothetical protein
MEQTRDNWTDARVDRLEKRIGDLETRSAQRIDGVYSTIYYVMLTVMMGLAIGSVVAAAAHH